MRIDSTRVGLLVGAALLCVSPTVAPAQARPSTADVAQRLAGPETRDWIRSREVLFMGNGRCESGERWRFGRNGVLRIRTCVQQQWRTSNYTWRLEPDGPLDYRLIIAPAVAENGRRVRFGSAGKLLVLRRMPDRKTRAVQDLELGLAQGRPPEF